MVFGAVIFRVVVADVPVAAPLHLLNLYPLMVFAVRATVVEESIQ
jgi:hypothetical protein